MSILIPNPSEVYTSVCINCFMAIRLNHAMNKYFVNKSFRVLYNWDVVALPVTVRTMFTEWRLFTKSEALHTKLVQ